MVTEFGKHLRILRVKHDETLEDMAKKLGVSKSYLSAVENGKRGIPTAWREVLGYEYGLSQSSMIALNNAIAQSVRKLTFELDRVSDTDRATLLSISNKY